MEGVGGPVTDRRAGPGPEPEREAVRDTATRGPVEDPPADRGAEPQGGEAAEPAARRPLIERLGMAAVALVMAILFGVLGVASWVGGEGFLAIMAGIGALMTAWAGANAARRG